MTNPRKHCTSILRSSLRRMAFALTLFFALPMVAVRSAQAQTFSVLHTFTDGADGGYPYAAVTVGPSGVLYSTASYGGSHDAGTVFKLSLVNSSWVFSPLYEFTGGSDGGNPWGGVVIGPNGALYGTTLYGGGENFGTVFELTPPATFCGSILCSWYETVLHAFTGTPDGAYPYFVNLTFDQAGNIYGTTYEGGMNGGGTVFELTSSGEGWTESILHSFGSGMEGGTDGENPSSGVVLDAAGNVYGTTTFGGTGNECVNNCGTVYELLYGRWFEKVLVNFNFFDNGANPVGKLIIDASGTLYGTTSSGGEFNADGGAFSLRFSGDQWLEDTVYSFTNGGLCRPESGLTMDTAGNFFGTCAVGGAHNDGWIFELTNCSQGCTLVDLHDFSGSDGMQPLGTPALDANGNLYGTTYYGGAENCGGSGCGVVWEIAGVDAPHKK